MVDGVRSRSKVSDQRKLVLEKILGRRQHKNCELKIKSQVEEKNSEICVQTLETAGDMAIEKEKIS